MTEDKQWDEMWVTRWAFSEGVALEKGHIDRKNFQSRRRSLWHSCRIGIDCFATKTEAIAGVEAMRTAKIASLRKQIAKLEALDVEGMVK